MKMKNEVIEKGEDWGTTAALQLIGATASAWQRNAA